MYVLSAVRPFFFTHQASLSIYTLSLHDALPISELQSDENSAAPRPTTRRTGCAPGAPRRRRPSHRRRDVRARAEMRGDRKSTRLNSSHVAISYAVFCLKKKKRMIL